MVPKLTVHRRARAIATEGFLFDEPLTRIALRLAGNDVTTREQATELFRDVRRGRPDPSLVKGPDGSVIGVWYRGAGASFDTSDWEQAQSWLRKWLPKIAEAEQLAESSASALARELTERLSLMESALRIGRRRGNYELTVYTLRDSIAKASIRAVLPFLLPYGWLRRLGKCQLRGCGEWFLREPKTGPLRQYCSDAHRNLAGVRRHRGKYA
jgi:hypothetical protein